MTRVYARADVPTPPTRVLTFLGSAPSRGPGVLGSRGLAETRWAPRREPSIVFAAPALTAIDESMLEALVAHEVAHVLKYRTGSARAADYAVLAAVAVLGAALLAATAVTWSTSWAALMPLTACVAISIPLAVWMAHRRREELDADRYAIGSPATLTQPRRCCATRTSTSRGRCRAATGHGPWRPSTAGSWPRTPRPPSASQR